MTLARRVGKLEAERSTTAIVLAWLAEAQAYPTLPDYLATLVGAPDEAFPLVRMGAQVETVVRQRVKGTPQEVWRAERRAFGDAAVLFELVLRCNLDTHALREFEGLRWALLSKWLGLLAAETELAKRTRDLDRDHAQREATDWRTTLTISLTSLYTEAAARAAIEVAYFDGHPVLFPELAQEIADLLARLEGLADMADVLPELRAEDGTPLSRAELRQQAEEAGRGRQTELVALARVEVLDLLGERERAVMGMERYLRTMAPLLQPTSEGGTGDAEPPPSVPIRAA